MKNADPRPIENYYRKMKDPSGRTVFGFDVIGFAEDRAMALFPHHDQKRMAYVQGFFDASQVLQISQQHNRRLGIRMKALLSKFRRVEVDRQKSVAPTSP